MAIQLSDYDIISGFFYSIFKKVPYERGSCSVTERYIKEFNLDNVKINNSIEFLKNNKQSEKITKEKWKISKDNHWFGSIKKMTWSSFVRFQTGKPWNIGDEDIKIVFYGIIFEPRNEQILSLGKTSWMSNTDGLYKFKRLSAFDGNVYLLEKNCFIKVFTGR